jgi:hypothetical protein
LGATLLRQLWPARWPFWPGAVPPPLLPNPRGPRSPAARATEEAFTAAQARAVASLQDAAQHTAQPFEAPVARLQQAADQARQARGQPPAAPVLAGPGRTRPCPDPRGGPRGTLQAGLPPGGDIRPGDAEGGGAGAEGLGGARGGVRQGPGCRRRPPGPGGRASGPQPLPPPRTPRSASPGAWESRRRGGNPRACPSCIPFGEGRRAACW